MAKGEIKRSHRLLIIGGSAGSLDVLLKLLPALQVPLAIAIVVVLHRRRTPGSELSDLLATRTKAPVKEIGDKELLQGGCIYIAPTEYHILFETNSTISLDYSEKVNYSRPSIDVAFESAAEVYGAELACLLLSGANGDGARGMRLANEKGATVGVQDPKTSDSPQMPTEALLMTATATVLSPEDMAAFVDAL